MRRMSRGREGGGPRFAALLFAAGLTGCVSPGPSPDCPADTTAEVGVLLLGDAGYHLDYVNDRPEDPTELEAFQERYRKSLARVGAADPEAEIPPHSTFPDSGHTVPASGLDPVGAAANRYCKAGKRCDFGVLLGDNIYPDGATAGADGRPDAERFRKIFVAPYQALFSTHPGFQFDVVLGNHDWYTSVAGALAQVDFHQRHPNYHMDGLYYSHRRQTPVGAVEIFALDTEVMLSKWLVPDPDIEDDGELPWASETQVNTPWVAEYGMTAGNQVEWLRQALRASDAEWKIVIGHHPLWSSSGGKFAQAQTLRRILLPVLCPLADAYIAGHDHTLEIHEQSCRGYGDPEQQSPLTTIVSGAASKQRRIHYNFARQQSEKMPGLKTQWAQGMIWGFGHLNLSRDSAVVTMITTPDDGSGKAETAYQYRFPRRTSSPAASRCQPDSTESIAR